MQQNPENTTFVLIYINSLDSGMPDNICLVKILNIILSQIVILINAVLFFPVPPKIQEDFIDNYIAYLNKPLMIYCDSDGIPRPSISWMKNGLFIDPFLDPNIQFLKEDSALLLKWARLEDSGKYTCIATNSAGQDEKNFNIHVYSMFCYKMLI